MLHNTISVDITVIVIIIDSVLFSNETISATTTTRMDPVDVDVDVDDDDDVASSNPLYARRCYFLRLSRNN